MATKHSLLLTAGLVLLLTGSTRGQPPRTPPTPTPIVSDAKRVIDLLEHGEFDKATERWDSAMLSQLPTTKVREYWLGLESQVGKLTAVGQPTVKMEGTYRTVVFPLDFERAAIEASVTYNGQGKVAGIYFRPKG